MKTCRAPPRPDDPLARLDQGTASCRSSPRISSREDELGNLAGGATFVAQVRGGDTVDERVLDRPHPRVALLAAHHSRAKHAARGFYIGVALAAPCLAATVDAPEEFVLSSVRARAAHLGIAVTVIAHITVHDVAPALAAPMSIATFAVKKD